MLVADCNTYIEKINGDLIAWIASDRIPLGFVAMRVINDKKFTVGSGEAIAYSLDSIVTLQSIYYIVEMTGETISRMGEQHLGVEAIDEWRM